MATTEKNVKAKAEPKATKPEPINPAIDPNKTAEERLAALTEQQDKTRSNS